MNQYPTWKNLLVLICVIVGIGFALPNFYGEDPALMIAKENGLTFSEQEIKDIDKFLNEDNSWSDSFVISVPFISILPSVGFSRVPIS